MITLANVRDWLKTQVSSPQWYIGKIDGNKEYCIGVFGISAPPPKVALGGLDNTSTAHKAVSILVHWGNDADEAERKAQAFYDAMFGQSNVVINGHRVVQFRMRTAGPVSIGTDGRDIYEFVVEATIIYER